MRPAAVTVGGATGSVTRKVLPRPSSLCTVSVPPASVRNAMADSETEPAPRVRGLHREERIEDPREHVLRDAGSVVGHLDGDSPLVDRDRAHADVRLAPMPLDGVRRIQDEVHDHLFEAASAHRDWRQCGPARW